MRLSAHFTLAELTRSETAQRLGISNDPPQEIVDRLILTADRLEGVRHTLGDNPLIISSGYRAPAVNVAVGGTENSAHCKGWAVDFVCPRYGSAFKVANELRYQAIKNGFTFDQLIYEFGTVGPWVHISFDPRMRGDVLTKKIGQPYVRGIFA